MLALAGSSFAQTAHFAGTQSAVGSGLSHPQGVAVDANGNVYIADTVHNRVLKVPATDPACATAGDCTTIGSGLLQPQGLAVDANGTVYIADSSNSRVLEVPASDPTCATPSDCAVITGNIVYGTNGSTSAVGTPVGVAVDSLGSVYIAQSSGPALACGTPASCQKIGGSNYLDSLGVALDSNGYLYLSTTTYGTDWEVLRLPFYDVGCLSSCTVEINSGLNISKGLAWDATNHLYVADSGNNRVLRFLLSGSCSTAGDCTNVGGALNAPSAVAMDGIGNLYIADTGSDRVLRVQSGPADFGSVAVGQPSGSTRTVIFTFDSAGSLGPTAVNVLTSGVPNADFTDAGTGTCATNGPTYTYAVGESCTVDVKFKPTLPGVRYGAVFLSDSSGNVLATGGVQGTGVGPRIDFLPGAVKTLYSGINPPLGIAVDSTGNIYYTGNGTVIEAPTTGPVHTVASFPYPPSALALDASGNLFVDLPVGPEVAEIAAVGGSIPAMPQITTIPLSFDGAIESNGLAVDLSGNIFLSVSDQGTVIELVKANGYAQTQVASGFSGPEGIAVDHLGNVFVAETSNHQVRELIAVNGTVPASPTIKPLGGGFGSVTGLTVDGLGNVYVNEDGTGLVKEIVAVNGTIPDSPTIRTLANLSPPQSSTPSSLQGIAVDANGNVFVTDSASDTIKEIDLADAPSLFSFPTATYDGQTDTADPPQSVQLLNGGNALLSANYLGIFISSNFKQTAGSGTPADCIASFSLATGDQCNLSIQFSPLTGAGAVTGAAQIFDNSGNNQATQFIPLSGTAIPQPYIGAQPASQTINSGQTATLAVTASSGYGLSYQWFKGVSPDTGNPVLGATSSSFTTPPLAATTDYWVVVFGGPYYTNSATAVITVNQPPAITSSPASQTINAGQTATLAVAATGTAPLAYQWYQGVSPNTNAPVTGATAATFPTPALMATTSYWVQVSNAAGTANGSTAIVTVNQPPTITSSPAGQTINTGQTVTLSVVATGTAPLTYQWYQGASPNPNSPVAGATAATLTTSPLTTTTRYWVRVSNTAGTTNSATAIVTVNQPPSCTFTVVGTSTALSVIATSTCTDPQNQPLTETISWGDGTSSPATGTNTHTYAAPGSFTVVLSATDSAGLSVTAAVQVTPSQLPVCTLGVVTGTASAYAVTTLANCSDPQGQPLQTSIDWGDGNIVPAVNHASNAHTYTASGMFNVTAIATDTSGLTGNSAPQPVNVLAQTATVSPGGSAPVTGSVPAQMTPAPNTQVTFICASVSTVLNGQPATNVLPSQFGITCTSPTITLTSSPTPVNVTIQTTTATTVASNNSGGNSTTAYGTLFPVSGLALFALGNFFPYKRRPRDSRLSPFSAIKVCALAALCLGLASCTEGFKPPPVIATPTGHYYVTLVETVVNPPAPTGFIQSSLIVPLPVGTGN